MSTFSYTASAHSVAPPVAVFALIADAPGWPSWAGFLISQARWEREGEPRPGGVGAIRRFGRWPQFGREEILAYDPPRHMEYTVLSGFPVRDYHADIDLDDDGAGGTHLSVHGTFVPKVRGTGRVLAAVSSLMIGNFARRAAAEAGRRAAPSSS
ncbi:MAG TPA: SRPBCC family protein [Acidimicrobiia bacterium]|nr:SRPBCC family protein [Acidimicrobiia bacterium]